MKIYFKRICHLSYSESETLCAWVRERAERFILQNGQGQSRWGESGRWGLGEWMTISTFSIAYHSHLDSWVCRRWLTKIWSPMTPWIYSVCICVWACVCVTMHICKCMHVCTCVSEHVAHMHKYVCVCAHVYIFGCTT